MYALKFPAPLPRPNRADRTLLPALLAVLLLFMVVLQFAFPAQNESVIAPTRLVLPKLEALEPSLALADPIILRNALFAPGRGGGKSTGTGPLDGAAFVGIVRGRGFARAVLQPGEGQAVSVPVGGAYRGWKLVSLNGSDALFMRDGIRHTATIVRGAIENSPNLQPQLANEQ
jgi:hypothetical protein